jgi:subtilisin family serine protease
MAWARRLLLAAISAWLSTCGPAAAADAIAGPSTLIEAHRQVLVMLRLPPEHVRAGGVYGDSYGDGLGHQARRRVAERLARQHGLSLLSDWPMPLLGVDCFIMAVPADQTPDKVAETLSRDPAVAWSQPMNIYHADGATPTHNDPLFRVQPAAKIWRLADLHQISTGRTVRVAVIDSTVEKNHPDLAGQVAISENFVVGQPATSEQHGTGIAGVIAARADNGLGIAGVAPGARLMALRACWQPAPAPPKGAPTVCDSLALAKALHFAILHDAQIINLSLSGPPDPLLGKLLDIALAHGDTVVGAYDRSLPAGGFPASYPGVVSVVDSDSGPSIPGVINAPGRDVPTTQPGGRWYFVDGSSYAAAHVSGLFALLREKSQSSRAISALAVSWPSGSIDACSTLLRVSGRCDCECIRASLPSTTHLQ